MENVAVVIPTKDRPREIATVLEQLGKQSVLPSHIVVVDSSGTTATQLVVERYVGQYQNVNIRYIHSKPSTTLQRNIGLDAIDVATDYVLLVDDDITIPNNTLRHIIDFFNEEAAAVGMTVQLEEHTTHSWLKRLLGSLTLLYTGKPFGMTRGIFNIVNTAIKRQPVAYLPGGFMAYRWPVIQQLRFDEWFTGYGLAEDLEFSLQVKAVGSIWVDPTITIIHNDQATTSSTARNWKLFGEKRVTNRWYIVKKHFRGQWQYWLGYFWATFWLTVINCMRGMCSKRYREEFFGNLQGILSLLHITKIPKK